jgi:hypothetical protein
MGAVGRPKPISGLLKGLGGAYGEKGKSTAAPAGPKAGPQATGEDIMDRGSRVTSRQRLLSRSRAGIRRPKHVSRRAFARASSQWRRQR